ncbi:MAG: helix-turn-helix transcriptional regulator [Rhodoglobus sp.]
MLLRHAIGHVVRRMRREKSQTLQQLAARSTVSLPYLSEVERGRKEASSEVLATICRALDIPMDAFLHEVSSVLYRDELAHSTPAEVIELAPSRADHGDQRHATVSLAA